MSALTDVVLVCDYAFLEGAAALVAITSAAELSRRGVKVHYFSAVGPVGAELEAAGIDVHCLDQPALRFDPNKTRAMLRGLWNRAAYDGMRKILRRCPKDSTVVHFHQWVGALSPSPIAAARRLGFPITFTFHDYTVSCPNNNFFIYPTNEICDLKPMSMKCVLRNCDKHSYIRKLWRIVRNQVQQRFGGIPADLRHGLYLTRVNREVLARFAPDGMTWHHVSNPINADRADRVDVARNKHFLFIGRLSPEKGGRLFAAASVKAGAHAIFVGDGDEREAILKINPDAVVTGWVSPDEVGALLRQARALVFPSVCYETQGLAVLEAQARGVPSIVSEQVAAREFVADGETGLLMRMGDVEDLAAKIQLLQDDDLVNRLSKNTYDAFWRDPPLIGSHVDKLVAAYSTILDNP